MDLVSMNWDPWNTHACESYVIELYLKIANSHFSKEPVYFKRQIGPRAPAPCQSR
jgi:hypothetical protein